MSSSNFTDFLSTSPANTSANLSTSPSLPMSSFLNSNKTVAKQSSNPIQVVNSSSIHNEYESSMTNFLFNSALSPSLNEHYFTNSNKNQTTVNAATNTNSNNCLNILSDYAKNRVSAFLPLEEVDIYSI